MQPKDVVYDGKSWKGQGIYFNTHGTGGSTVDHHVLCTTQDTDAELKMKYPDDAMFESLYNTEKDTSGNPVGYDSANKVFKFNLYCSLFDTIRNIPMAFWKSEMVWRSGKMIWGVRVPPLGSNFTDIDEAIEYAFMKINDEMPTKWGREMTQGERESFTGLSYEHKNLYEECRPAFCTYSEQRARGSFEIGMLLAGLAGSIWLYATQLGGVLYEQAVENSVEKHEKRNHILADLLTNPNDLEEDRKSFVERVKVSSSQA